MSRSFKHTPICKSSPSSRHGGMKWVKRNAAKAVRRADDVPNGKRGYRLLINPYDVHDQVSRRTWTEVVLDYYAYRDVHRWYVQLHFPSWKRWAKYYLHK